MGDREVFTASLVDVEVDVAAKTGTPPAAEFALFSLDMSSVDAERLAALPATTTVEPLASLPALLLACSCC